MKPSSKTAFVPQLIIAHGTMNLDFYKNAFGAIETKHLTNDDGSIHVSEMFIDGAMFHFHEEAYDGKTFSPGIDRAADFIAAEFAHSKLNFFL